MQRLTMLVTPEGQWVFPNTAEFYAALGDPNPDYDAIAFAVKNLGFIRFEVIEKSIIEIELHPRNVELPALLAVQQQLLSSEISLFRIKYFDDKWQSEISSTAEHAVERLSQLAAPPFILPYNERFLVEPQDPNILFDSEDCPFRPLAQKWRMSFGNFDPSVISLAVNHQLISRMMIIGVKPREQEPRFRFIGHAHRWLGGSYYVSALGEKVQDQPDKEYGEWVCKFYRSIAATRQPRFDLVTASMQYQNEPGAPRRTITYERVLLPWKTASDEVFITLCSRNAPAGNRMVSDPASVNISEPRKSARSS
ncbi:MAG TPA: hypothetical protein VGS13_02235 [Stellaceae bacterium]|nr:hypothetical protein [Stellaceae bacterium]